MCIEEYWKNFLTKNNLSSETKYQEAFKFGFNDKQADELLKLVIRGKKTATTSPYFEDEEYVKVGDYSIVLDSKNQPCCIIKTTKLTYMSFKNMTYDICKLEGEDKILDTWIYNHTIFLSKACEEKGLCFSIDMPIIFEEFEVVYK